MKKNKKTSNQEIIKITIMFGILFLGMMSYFAYFQITKAKDIINNPRNKRYQILSEKIVRGQIMARDGEVLAETQSDKNGNETRIYPYDNLFSQVVGINSHGRYGLEADYNFELLTSHADNLEQFGNDLKGNKNIGDNVITTLDVKLQKTASEAIGDNMGGAVVLEPDTGNILAMVSKPDFNPNKIDEIWDDITAEGSNDSSLLNRASQGLYTPGSVFKIFTLLEYTREKPKKYKNYQYTCHGAYDGGNFQVSCFDGNIHGNLDLMGAFSKSCNSAFIDIGLKLDLNSFRKNNEGLLFNSRLPVDFAYNKSSFVLQEGASKFDVAQTSIGQGKTQVTPLHMAMIASAVANEGELMVPRLVSKIEDHNGYAVENIEEKSYGSLFSKEEANRLKKYMRGVVESGTGTKLNQGSYTAYGKTGTAETGNGSKAHSWFVGFATKDDKTIAVAFVMENMPEGSTWAVPAVKQVFDAYFE